MNSMLRQHHIRLQDLQNYLRGYDSNKPQTPEDWAIQESKSFVPGMLVFCLDSIAAPPGLAQFSKKEPADQGETYRIKDMSVVVSMTDDKPLVVNITASAFDLRFLEQLLLEKARKAILDGRDFLYVSAAPAQALDAAQAKALENLATTSYRQGGSRRTLAAGDNSGAQEPAQALLSALGATINTGGVGKQVLDIGNVCHLLFAPEGRQEDKNKILMKSSFTPLPGDEGVMANDHGQNDAPALQIEDITNPYQQDQSEPVVAPADPSTGWTEAPAWVEPEVPQADVPQEAWQPPAAEIPFQDPAAQWTQPGMLDQAAASFLNPEAPVQVPDFPQPPQGLFEIPDASPEQVRNMPKPAPLGSPARQSMTSFKALEDTGTFRKFDNENQAAAPNVPPFIAEAVEQQDIQQAASMAFAASAAAGDSSTSPAPMQEEHIVSSDEGNAPGGWNTLGAGQAPPFIPPAVNKGGPQQIRPQANRPSVPIGGAVDALHQTETGIYQQFGTPPAKAQELPVQNNEVAAAPLEAATPYQQEFQTPDQGTAEVMNQQPPVDESKLSISDRLSLKLSRVKSDASNTSVPAMQAPNPAAPSFINQQPEQLFGWEQPEDVQTASSDVQQQPSTFQLPDAPQQDEWQNWGDNTQVEETQQGAHLASALNDLMDNQGNYDQQAPYASTFTPQDLSQAVDQSGFVSQFAPQAENQSESAAWTDFQESFNSQQASSFSEPAPGFVTEQPVQQAQEYADIPQAIDAFQQESTAPDMGWEQPSVPEAGYTDMSAMDITQPEIINAQVQNQNFTANAPEQTSALDHFSTPAPLPAGNPFDSSANIKAINPFLTPPPAPIIEPAYEESQPAAGLQQEIPSSDDTTSESIQELASASDGTPLEIEPSPEVIEEISAAPDMVQAPEPEPAIEPEPAPAPAPRAPRKPTAEEEAAIKQEMASFEKKLEQQLAKAAKKLNSRVEEIKLQVSKEMENLAAESEQSDKATETVLAELGTRFNKQLENVTEDCRLKMSDAAANGRYTIKQLLHSSNTQIEEERNQRYEALREQSKQFREDTTALARNLEKETQETVNKRAEELAAMVDQVVSKLKETGDAFVALVDARFQRFTERMAEETNTVTALLDRSVNSMMDEIDATNEKSTEKMRTGKADFEQTINYHVRTAQLTLSRKTRKHLTLSLLPKLNERKEILRTMSTEMSHRFAQESTLQVSNQMQGLESSLTAAKQQLNNLVTECLSNIDSVGRGQQAGLEEIFKDSSQHIEKNTQEVTSILTTTEKQIQETELVCKKLAETSSVDADPQLTEVRNSAHTKVLQIKQQASSGLITTIDSGCDRLDQVSQAAQTDLTNLRTQYAQGARHASDAGLARMRDAIQEALAAIQAAREKYME